MKILYIATPINSRPEKTMEEKLEGARKRIEELKEAFRETAFAKDFETYVSTFDVNPSDERNEPKAMGRCIEAVLSSDAILLDKGWMDSKGCRLEYKAAYYYGKQMYLRGNESIIQYNLLPFEYTIGYGTHD